MSAGRCSFLVSDMVAVPLAVSPDFRARCLAVRFDMAQDIFFMVTSNRFWDFIYQSPVFTPSGEEYALVSKWFDLAGWVYDTCPDALAARVLKSLAVDYITLLSWRVEESHGDMGTPPVKNRAWAVVNGFLALLGRHYAAHHDVAYYADRLSVTPNYLNIIVRRYVGTSAKEQINLQLTLVMKMLLDTTDMPVKGIAERLGFDDPSYMCRVFRRREGMSPVAYRNMHRKREPEA